MTIYIGALYIYIYREREKEIKRQTARIFDYLYRSYIHRERYIKRYRDRQQGYLTIYIGAGLLCSIVCKSVVKIKFRGEG